MTPLELALIPAFVHLGGALLPGFFNVANFSVSAMADGLRSAPIETLKSFQDVFLSAIFGWFVASGPIFALLYVVLEPVLKHVLPRPNQRQD